MTSGDFRLTTGESQRVDMSDPVELNLADMRGRWPEKTGRHFWVVGMVFDLDGDPERALDNMDLGAHNLIGFEPIRCLWCFQLYRSGVGMADRRCPGVPVD